MKVPASNPTPVSPLSGDVAAAASADALAATSPAPEAGRNERHFRTDHLLTNLGKRAFSGGIVTIVSQGLRFGLYLALTVVLARLLSKPDFGLVAMAGTLTAFLRMLREAGLSTATVQQETITHAQVSNLFWVNIGLGLLCTLAGITLSPAVAWFYRDERLVGITIWLAFTFLAGGAAVQHLALLNRQMRFKAMALVDIGSMTVGLLVGVGMALTGWRYWSLVGSQLATSLAEVVFAWIASGWRPQWPKARVGTRSMLHFGASLTFAALLRRITAASDTLLIGRFYGADVLGVYTRGMALIMRPLDQFLLPFDAVFLPVLSRLQHQPERYRRMFLQVYDAMALVSFPVAGLFLGLSQPIVLTLLGKRWGEVVPVFASLSLAALYYPVAGASMWLLTTQGRNRDIVRAGVMISLVSIGSCFAGVAFGAVGVALAFSLFGLLVRLPLQYRIVGGCGPVRTVDLWKVFLKHLPSWAVVSAAAYLPQLFASMLHPVFQLVLGGGAGVLAGAVLVFCVPPYRREVQSSVDLVKQIIARRREAAE